MKEQMSDEQWMMNKQMMSNNTSNNEYQAMRDMRFDIT
jgi:hypothetical protein